MTNQHNNQWVRKSKRNTSGVKGVYWNEKAKKWHTQIQVNGKRKHIGYFDDINEAAYAYKEKQRDLNAQGHKFFIED